MQRRWIILLSALLGMVAAQAADDTLPGRDDYAYGFKLSLQEPSGFFALDLPLAVYRSVTDPQLRDAGVFNADGQPVPRLFEHRPPAETAVEERLGLGLVPLYGEQASQPDQLRLLLRSADGTTLEYAAPDSGSGENTPTSKPVSSYIADAKDLGLDPDKNPVALEFAWPPQADGFIGKLDIQDSDDLQSWQGLATGTLADLQYEEARIAQNQVPLPRKPRDYLRIRWQNMPEGWSLNAMSAIYKTTGATERRDSISLEGTASGETEREYLFDAGGYPPVDRINLLLPDENIVLRASVFYRHDVAQRWLSAHNGLFYNIKRQGNSVRSEPATVKNFRARYWKIVINSGAVTQPPLLQLGWYPDQLLFVAQGNAPFELVTGRARDRLDWFPQDRILGDHTIFKLLRDSGQAGLATMGPRAEISGASSLQIAPTSTWKVVLLWLGLGGAVLLVGVLVWSLMRDMQQA